MSEYLLKIADIDICRKEEYFALSDEALYSK